MTKVSSLPQFCPAARGLDDLELLLNGGLAPHTSYDETIRLDLPDDLQPRLAEGIEIVDPEGLPLARLDASGLTELAPQEVGAFRRLHLSPAQTRAAHPNAVTVPVVAPLSAADLDAIDAARGERAVVLLALAGHGTPQGISQVGLVRATLAAAELLDEAHVVVAPLASRGDSAADHELGQLVARNYASGDLLAPLGEGELPESVADIVDADQPTPDQVGLVIFFTGLSGSGKSTIARALHESLLEQGARTVTSLDGDVVRRNLSAGLGFSREDRETNIRRIGWVAAEISRHRGIAICSPIAPFDATRQDVRRFVEEAGGAFFLVHVATSLAECERRDKKGLYAKARAGEIGEFTGISSPYETPLDADVVVDTEGRTIEEALADVLTGLRAEGYFSQN